MWLNSKLVINFDKFFDKFDKFFLFKFSLFQLQEKRLKRRLDDCWIKNIGAPILYLWIQTIEEEVVNAMKSNPIIDLDSFMNVDQKFSRVRVLLNLLINLFSIN